MAAKYWLKLYYEMLDDPKIGQLRPALRWRFIECLLVAGECDEDGYLPPPAQYAWRVRDSVETVETDFVQLAEGGVLSQDGGRWLVTKFAERQAPVSGAERVARHRERQRKEQYYGTSDITETKQVSNDTVTKRYIDTDIDTDKIHIQKPAPNGAYPHETMHNQEMPTPPSPRADAVQEMVSHIAGAVKTVYAIGKNSDDFERVANALIDYGITSEQVDAFPAWWSENGHYSGRPALKSLLDNIREAAEPMAAMSSFGKDFKVFNE